jgi:hypothetical protein
MTGIASGSWALVNYILLQFLGPMFNQLRYSEAFWTIALPCGGSDRLAVVEQETTGGGFRSCGARLVPHLRNRGGKPRHYRRGEKAPGVLTKASL